MKNADEMKELSMDELDGINGGKKTFRKKYKDIICSECSTANEWYVNEPRPVICEFCSKRLVETEAGLKK